MLLASVTVALVDQTPRPQRFLREGDWYGGADIEGGFLTTRTFDNLMAFWPGMQTLMGKGGGMTRCRRYGEVA